MHSESSRESESLSENIHKCEDELVTFQGGADKTNYPTLSYFWMMNASLMRAEFLQKFAEYCTSCRGEAAIIWYAAHVDANGSWSLADGLITLIDACYDAR